MAKYKIEVDRDTCIGDELCCSEAPNTFEMDDEDIAVVKDGNGDSAEDILAAAESCPVDAICLRDQDTGEQVYPEE
jgi:ferredoxin